MSCYSTSLSEKNPPIPKAEVFPGIDQAPEQVFPFATSDPPLQQPDIFTTETVIL